VAADFKVSRAKQDEFAASSHTKAVEAQKNGWFKEEIVPVKTTIQDKDGNESTVVIEQDDGVRPGTTAEKLAKLRPAFSESGSTTAGNASQVSDGAAAVLLMKRKVRGEEKHWNGNSSFVSGFLRPPKSLVYLSLVSTLLLPLLVCLLVSWVWVLLMLSLPLSKRLVFPSAMWIFMKSTKLSLLKPSSLSIISTSLMKKVSCPEKIIPHPR
jgi:hypothetical protein